jgi:hypothetical protein
MKVKYYYWAYKRLKMAGLTFSEIVAEIKAGRVWLGGK